MWSLLLALLQQPRESRRRRATNAVSVLGVLGTRAERYWEVPWLGQPVRGVSCQCALLSRRHASLQLTLPDTRDPSPLQNASGILQGNFGCHVTYLFTYFLKLFFWWRMPQGFQWSLPNGELIRLLICCSGFGFIPFRTVIKGKQECCGFLRPTCLLFSHTFLCGAVPLPLCMGLFWFLCLLPSLQICLQLLHSPLEAAWWLHLHCMWSQFMLFLHGHLIWRGQKSINVQDFRRKTLSMPRGSYRVGLIRLLQMILCRLSNSQSHVAGPTSLYPGILQNCLGNGQCNFKPMILKYFGWWIFRRIWKAWISSPANGTYAHISKFYI